MPFVLEFQALIVARCFSGISRTSPTRISGTAGWKPPKISICWRIRSPNSWPACRRFPSDARSAANKPLHLTRRHHGLSGFNVSPAAAAGELIVMPLETLLDRYQAELVARIAFFGRGVGYL